VETFHERSGRPLRDREELLANAADVLRGNKRRYAETMTEEMGKPIDQAVGEVEKCAWACDHYAEYAGSYLEDVFREAGYPKGAFQTLLVGSDRMDAVVADDRIRAATLTGSGPAGRAVAETAGRHLQKTVLELGGSDPFVVLDDADLESAVETGVLARTQNGGQSCIAAKRFHQVRPADPLRRQGLGLRARTLRGRYHRVRQQKDRLDSVTASSHRVVRDSVPLWRHSFCVSARETTRIDTRC
jgi:acyl-CoA reductase-like NAD-dependent aldehyde dehydrogenase